MGDYSARYDQEKDIIVVEMHGNFDAMMLSSSTSALVDELNSTKCTQILLDHTDATPNLSITEQYQRPNIALNLGVPKTSDIAIVYKEDHETYHFIETVAINNGINVKIFLNIEEALEWLKKSKAN